MSVSNSLGYEGYPLPVGTIFPYIGTALPNAVQAGVLVCDGAYYSPTEWSDLFEAIGYAYGQNGDLFRVPLLNTTNDSFLTGAPATDPARQTGSVVLQAPAGTRLTAANIPSFSSKVTDVNTTGAEISGPGYLQAPNANVLAADRGSAAGAPLIAADATGNTGVSSMTLGSTLTYTNNAPTPIPETQYTVTGAFNPEYVSVIYLIKARYALPAPVSAGAPNVPPPTSNVYNTNRQLGGFTDFGGAIQFAYY